MQLIDERLPYIAFVRYYDTDKQARGFRPFELYNLMFNEKLRGVCMIQTFIYGRNSDIVNPVSTSVVVEYIGPPSKFKEKVIAKNTKCQITLLKKAHPTLVQHMNARGEDTSELVKYFSKPIHDAARDQLTNLVRYLTFANGGIRITHLRAKFIEQEPVHLVDGKERP